MQRHEIINAAVNRLEARTYLEIGVEEGRTFNAVSAEIKVAVDPSFKVPRASLRGESYAMTSDAYFDDFPRRQFDLVFVDGLHVFEQALRDVLRAERRLTSGGLILVDDCYPSDAVAADRSHESCVRRKTELGHLDRNWMGDVYKIIPFINDFCDNLSFALLEESMGILAVWREPRAVRPWLSDLSLIADCRYDDFVGDLAPRTPRMNIEKVLDQVVKTRSGSILQSARSLISLSSLSG